MLFCDLFHAIDNDFPEVVIENKKCAFDSMLFSGAQAEAERKGNACHGFRDLRATQPNQQPDFTRCRPAREQNTRVRSSVFFFLDHELGIQYSSSTVVYSWRRRSAE